MHKVLSGCILGICTACNTLLASIYFKYFDFQWEYIRNFKRPEEDLPENVDWIRENTH